MPLMTLEAEHYPWVKVRNSSRDHFNLFNLQQKRFEKESDFKLFLYNKLNKKMSCWTCSVS